MAGLCTYVYSNDDDIGILTPPVCLSILCNNGNSKDGPWTESGSRANARLVHFHSHRHRTLTPVVDSLSSYKGEIQEAFIAHYQKKWSTSRVSPLVSARAPSLRLGGREGVSWLRCRGAYFSSSSDCMAGEAAQSLPKQYCFIV